MTIGWGIIGIGKHAERSIGPALARLTNGKFIAVCSRSKERATAFGVKFGAKRAYDSLEEMLKDSEVNAIYIATPNNLHKEQTVQAAAAGKHVLCEKPMALTVAECESMIEACQKNAVKLGVTFQNRFHPAHIETRRLIQSGEVGDIYVVKAQYCHGWMGGHWKGWRNDPEMAGGGALMGTGLHPIDLVRYLLGKEVKEIRAATASVYPDQPVEDMVYIILHFEGAVRAIIVTGVLAPRSDNDAVLYGTRAKITCHGTVGMPLFGELLVEGESLNMKMSFATTDSPWSALYQRTIQAFNRSIEENTEPETSGHNGMRMVKIANTVLESARTGKSVKIDS